MQGQQSHIGDEQNLTFDICEQDTGEFQNVVSEYLPFFYRRAYRYVGNPHDAEDAVQDALLSAYKHLDQFKEEAKMTTWLTSIVTNSALTQLRKRRRQPHVFLDEKLGEEQDHPVADRLADSRPSPEGECIRLELHEHLMQFVGELSPSLRMAIQLRDLEGLTTSEAAVILGVPEGTLKARVSRGRTKLKRRMRSRGRRALRG